MTAGTLNELVGPYHWILSPPWSRFPPPILIDWRRACANAVQSGTVDEIQRLRDDYQKVLLAHIKIIEGYLSLITEFDLNERDHMLFGPSDDEFRPTYPERMAQIRISLQAHYDRLFPRWQTIDDLEQIVLETVSPSSENLKALAATHSPPQSWYDESVDLPTPTE